MEAMPLAEYNRIVVSYCFFWLYLNYFSLLNLGQTTATFSNRQQTGSNRSNDYSK
jgi:hypothetical protein